MSAQGVMLEHLGPSEQHSLVGPRRLDGNAPPPLAIDSVESVIKRTAGEENAGQARRRRHEVVDAAGAGVARAAQTRFAALQAVQAAQKALSAYTAQGLSFDSRLWRTCTNRIDATSGGDCKHRSIDAASASGRTYGSRLMRVATDWADEVSWRACTSQCGVI